MKRILSLFLLGIVIGFILFVPTFYLFCLSGMAPVTVSAKELPLEHLMAKTALHAKMDKEIIKTVPIPSDTTSVKAGAHVYIENCAVCHGGPSQSKTFIAAGMFPRPPQLFVGRGMVTDDLPGETF